MPRLFASLAIATVSLFILTAALALTDDGSAPDRHVLLAVGTLLMSCFIQVLGFTYLTVTGKVIAQAAHLAGLDPACLKESRQYKRTFTNLLAIVVFSTVLVSATGGAVWRSPDALILHVPTAMLLLILHVWVYWREHHLLSRNAELMGTTLKTYSTWRAQRVRTGVPGAAGM